MTVVWGILIFWGGFIIGVVVMAILASLNAERGLRKLATGDWWVDPESGLEYCWGCGTERGYGHQEECKRKGKR